MGKYGASLIHEWWSDWHYKNIPDIKRTAWMADADDTVTSVGSRKRTWVEMRSKGIIAILELKWKWAVDFGMDLITRTEQVLMNFYEKNGKPFYILVIDPLPPSPKFYIYRPYIQESNNGKYSSLANMSEKEMMDWINADYRPDYLDGKKSKEVV